MRICRIVCSLFILLSILCGCINNTVVYRSYQSVSPNGWYRNDTLPFSIHIPDSGFNYQTHLLVRTLDTYPYQNLALAVEYIGDSLILRTDTLYFNFTAKTTEYKPNEWGGMKQASILIDEKHIEHPDTFSFKIISLMKDFELKGINDICIWMEREN